MAYRIQGSDDSSSASDSEDESYMSWKRKKTDDGDAPMEGDFVNPVLEQKKAGNSGAKLPSYMRFRKNNIWGSVLQEQALTNVISRVDVEHQDAEKVERDVESYSYNRSLQPADREDHFNAHEEMASDCEEEDYFKPSVKDRLGTRNMDGSSDESTSNKQSVKDRLGNRAESEEDIADRSGGEQCEMDDDRRRNHRRHKSRKRTLRDRLGPHGYKTDPLGSEFEPPKMYSVKPKVPINADDSMEVLVNGLVENLREPKVELISRVVEAIGKQKVMDLFNETETIEENGGLLINNNTRRRTPGGVFFFLLRNDKSIDEEVKQAIFKEDKKKLNTQRRERKKFIESNFPQYKYASQKKGPPGRSKSLDSTSENKERPKTSSHSASSSPTTRTHDNSPEQATMETVEENEDVDTLPKPDAETGELEEGELLDDD